MFEKCDVCGSRIWHSKMTWVVAKTQEFWKDWKIIMEGMAKYTSFDESMAPWLFSHLASTHVKHVHPRCSFVLLIEFPALKTAKRAAFCLELWSRRK